MVVVRDKVSVASGDRGEVACSLKVADRDRTFVVESGFSAVTASVSTI